MPIRDENIALSPTVNTAELGTTYVQAATQRIRDARFYVHEMQAPFQTTQTALVNLYPAASAADVGPVKQVIIPVSNGGITGTGLSLAGGATVAACVANPGDAIYLRFSYNAVQVQQRAGFFFAINQYPELANKRILNVSMIYAGNVQDTDANGQPIAFIRPDLTTFLTYLEQIDNAGNTGPAQFFGQALYSNLGVLSELSSIPIGPSGSPSGGQVIGAVDIGDINNFWLPATPFSGPAPWRYVDLQRFEASATNRQSLRLTVQLPTELPNCSMKLDYVALRVIYCEETRVAYGAATINPYKFGMNSITMRNLLFATDPAIVAGTYLPTISWVSPGDLVPFIAELPKVNGLRELYQIPTHLGTEIDIPFPLEESIGDQFTKITTHVLPQLSLHASGGTLTEPHVYGRQGAAQAWGTITATQDIYDDISGVAASYPQVRFYARRFGDTTIPLTLTGVGGLSGSTVSITAADFDALEEIIDGWKEVTLRFASPPSMGTVAGNPAWTWSAISETAGNRWEILAACAPAISGVPGNLYNLVPAPNRLGTATYQPPAGGTVELTWMPQGVASPWVTGSTIDAACDAVLIFSQDPTTITGVSISQLTQTITGIGLDCGSLPCCIPTGIGYQRISWSAVGTVDDFQRDVVSGWGMTACGQPWVTGGGGTADNFHVSDGIATVVFPGTDTAERTISLNGVALTDGEVMTTFVAPVLATGGIYLVDLTFRRTDDNNTYLARASLDTVGTVDVSLISFLAGVPTTLDSENNFFPYGPGTEIAIKAQFQGTALKVKVWDTLTPEPIGWTCEATNATFTTGSVDLHLDRAGGNTNNDLTLAFSQFSATPLINDAFGAYELQRFDYLDPTGDFQTIMRSTDFGRCSFNDYEARVGVTSVYRIRSLNALNFAGAWSTYVTGTVVTPGVSGACANDDGTGALIFTSNAAQSGIYNAAYVMQWEGFPDETFSLPEAGMVDFQPMYGRDGSVAFHGTERGLSAFSRLILLHAAAIQPVRLADAQILRNLAWADLPYVCVRDDIGDRWFANVRVPSVSARLNRTKYMAKVDVTELTTDPYPVNP